MLRNYTNIILAVAVLGISTGLLFAHRFDTEPHQPACINETCFSRGEIISSDETQLVTLGDSSIWMEENTEIKVINGMLGEELINVIQGRIVVKGDLSIQTREVFTRIIGVSSFVHYSWEDRIEIAEIEGDVVIETATDQKIIDGAVSLQTLAPYETNEIQFDPENSSAKLFYQKALEKEEPAQE